MRTVDESSSDSTNEASGSLFAQYFTSVDRSVSHSCDSSVRNMILAHEPFDYD